VVPVRGDVRSTPGRVGKYDLKAVIARTAQSVVYDGWDSNIARRVAIKLIPLRHADDEYSQEALARFRRGAQAAGQLNHRNIVSVYDYGETEDAAYLVMEFIEGPTLKTLFDTNRKFTLAEIGSIVGGILDALQYSHDRKVVHRDMKPANVMFTADNTVKITDFGIARLEDSEMTQAGMVIGTPAYMSPEQFLGDKVDLRSDIYSTGVLLYHILTGERPYEGTLATIMHKVLYGAPLLPSRLSTSVTPALDSVVTRAMARKREDRFESAVQFKSELIKALSITNASEAPLTPPPRKRLPPPGSSGPVFPWGMVLAALTVVTIAAGGAFGWHFLNTPDAPKISETRPVSIKGVPASPSPSLATISSPPSETIAASQPMAIAAEVKPLQTLVDQPDATSVPLIETTHQPALFAPEVRPPEPEPPSIPPAKITDQSLPLAIESAPERKPAPRFTTPKSGNTDWYAPATVPDRRVPKNSEPSATQSNRSGPRTATPADNAGADDALRRLRNGVASLTHPAPVLEPPSTVYATTSSSAVGLLCQSVTTDSAGELGLDGARGMVVLGVTNGSAAAIAGIRQQDVILKINGTEINDLSSLPRIASNTPAGTPVRVEIFRHGNRQMVQLQVDKIRQ
jgi:serine/threonine protein kinase